MKSWVNRKTLHKSIVKNMMDASAGKKDSIVPELPDDLARWLSQLTLLYGVPTEYLIPDPRMLPTESLRFFFLDRNWLDRLVDGALSTGVLSSRDQVFNQLFFQQIYAQIDKSQLELRSDLRNETAKTNTTGGTISGFVFRSQVISGWPGIEINAYQGDTLLTILRMDRLSPNVLLCLFYGVPDRVDFSEPAEGLHFGITREESAQNYEVSIRGLGYPSEEEHPAGMQIESITAPGKMRQGTELGVVDIAGLAGSVTKALIANNALAENKLTPAGFAIQLTQGAGRQSYQIKDEKGEHYPQCNYTINSI
ncbi:hypothetical protein GKZ90_0006280 [Flavobacterium sp. MC2016-06]|jgi:hypothetical protein|uniref:hypothetical protein n=1 Tax=Flavobacterium sp. MC2016-06 TaxID=2676308 RepID=UPI0012BB0402|nr:hypothetical protein [Flavobacterium sp. MC2016-06]MBU3857746.1 hypothetical protein [Flavobacterium sp. MC2016-06]